MWIYPGKRLQRNGPEACTGLAFHHCTPLRFLEQRTGSCEHSLMFKPSLLLASAMIQNRRQATWLLPSLLVGTWTRPLIPRVLEKTLPAFTRRAAFLVTTPTATQLHWQLKADFGTVRISNQSNKPSVTPAPYANYSACETSKQTTSCVNNFGGNTQRKRSIC